MKKIALFLSLFTFFYGQSQSLPINFETAVTTSDFIDFDGGTATVVDNPSVAGINTSATVGYMVRDGGAIWGGSKIALTDNLDFSVMTKLTMKIYTAAPVGTVVKLKLESAAGSAEVDALTTTSSEWETLEWNFAGTPSEFNEIVFMFDFGTTGDGSINSSFYFDDVEQVLGVAAPVPITLPLDFEGGTVNTDFLNFSGASASIIPNPQMNGDNPSNTVCEIVRDGGELWAGSRVFLAENLDLSTRWHLSMKVYTDAPVGTRIKLELEGPNGKRDLDVLTTVSGQWETVSWNFDGTTGDYDKMIFLFDFGKVGDGSASSTFLFDDLQQFVGPALAAPVPTPLPIDFESAIVTTDFTSFFGAVATVIPNPQMDANNPSATVGQFVRSGGQSWAQSKIILTEFMDFSTLSSITMKVYTEAPVGTLLKLKVEATDSGFANERDTYTTVSGEWATYRWDFAGDPPVYNVITLMLGYGAVGDASPASTYLMDDIAQVAGLPPVPMAEMPVDFEDAVSTHYFFDFDGAGVEVVENPQMDATNPSDSVAVMVRNGGQIWAGSKLFLEDNLDLVNAPNISMKVFTEAPVGTTIKLKLENNGGAETEVDVLTTTSGAWETLTWDFTGAPNDFNSLVFMFDFGAVGDSSATSTFFFDEVSQNIPMASMPVNFEDEVSTDYFFNFDGAGVEVIENPQMDATNPSDSVAVMVRNGGQIWAGSKLFLDENLDLATAPNISMKVFTEAPVGTTIKLKLESNSGVATEVDVLTTTSGAWETLNWDFTGRPNDFNSLVFMFDFGAVGDSSATSTFFFDDVTQDVNTSIAPLVEIEGLAYFPNPAKDRLTFTSEEQTMETISIFDILGNSISVHYPNSRNLTIDVADLASGIYVATIATPVGTKSIKLMIE